MANATADDVRCVDVANQLKGYTDLQLQCIIDNETLCYFNNTAVWSGQCRITGMALATAHIAFRAKMGAGAASGQVTAQAGGGLSRSYGTTSSSTSATEDYWKSTEFGRRYLTLLRSRITTPIVLGVC